MPDIDNWYVIKIPHLDLKIMDGYQGWIEEFVKDALYQQFYIYMLLKFCRKKLKITKVFRDFNTNIQTKK